ncbi:MAG: hypothetical protein WC415_02090 [Patescibacteria group bacterium]
MFIKTLIILLVPGIMWFPVSFAETINGKTVDSVTSLPVGGVKIYLASPECSTFSTSNGNFELFVPTTNLIFQPKKIIISQNERIIFSLNGKVISNKQSVKRLPFGGYVAVLGQVAEKALSISNRLILPTISQAAEVTGMAKTASVSVPVIFSHDGYQTVTRVVQGGNLGEVLLSPEEVVVEVGINIDSLGLMVIIPTIIPSDTGVVFNP